MYAAGTRFEVIVGNYMTNGRLVYPVIDELQAWYGNSSDQSDNLDMRRTLETFNIEN